MKLITQILHKYREDLGDDYEAYHNHCQRVYHYSCILLLFRERKKLAVAAAFHDLDIWMSNTMDYLKGASELAKSYLSSSDFDFVADEIKFIIERHHQLRPIRGNMEAEAFRKADLIDLSAGVIKFNLPKSIIEEMEDRYPRLGFTWLITKKVAQYALDNPWRPLPMLRW